MSREPAISPPADAISWLERWRAIGGGVTIAVDGNLHTWRLSDTDKAQDLRNIEHSEANVLLGMMAAQPSLIAAVRAVAGSEAALMAARALKTMGRKDS